MINTDKYIKDMKKIQENLLSYIENDANVEEKFQNLNTILDDLKIRENKHELKSLLHMILKIANNHHRGPDFFTKIERLLTVFKEEMTKNFSNSEIFSIFKTNKRILLFFIEEGILILDNYVAKKFLSKQYIKNKYPQYFFPELKPFIDDKWIKVTKMKKMMNIDWVKTMTEELPDNFYENRKIGENESNICKIIRKDSFNEFKSLTDSIDPQDYLIDLSIYETNLFLLREQKLSLIEYAAFFGASKIFQYLLDEENYSKNIWLYAIHGQNEELIDICEYNKVKYFTEMFHSCVLESIKCHHDFFLNTFYNDEKNDSYSIFYHCLKYYNFIYMNTDLIDPKYFYQFCKFDYYIIVDELLENNDDIDINKQFTTIFK